MRVFDIMLEFRVVLFAKTRLMVDVCPLLSSLVGTFGKFVNLNDSPLSHSRVSLVCAFRVFAPSSQLGSLMFQSLAMIVGMEWWGMWLCRWSAVHSWIELVLGWGVFWLYILISMMGGHVAPSLLMFRIM